MGKIIPFEQLGSIRNGKKIVQCHGVFDLLHIGHIRHLQEARKHGDLLIVTVTDDKYVNKGPGRPILNNQLRVESLAALECVDYVSSSPYPTAVESILLLRPDVYVKGQDYVGQLHEGEQRAVESIGGKTEFTNGKLHTTTSLVNLMSGFPDNHLEYINGFHGRFSVDDLYAPLKIARKLKILIVGETILDEYQYCEPLGRSSKDPILALKQTTCEKFNGGVLAVANNLADFCPAVDVISGVTITKRRFVDYYSSQKLFETYSYGDLPTKEAERKTCEVLRSEIGNYDLVIVMDYGHSMMTPEIIDIVCKNARFLALNVQVNAGNWGFNRLSKYPRADYVTATELELRTESGNATLDILTLLKTTFPKLGFGKMFVTQGTKGCMGYDGTDIIKIPAFTNRVVDRMGAGDAFFALSSLYAAQKKPLELIGFAGSLAGAVAVKTMGHRKPITRDCVKYNPF